MEHAAREMCLRMLTLQPRTRKELADGLRRRGISDEIADSVLDRFGDVGLVDDAAFAKAWVTSRHRGRGLARKALAHELHRRGVDHDSVSAAVDQIDADDELAAARELVRRRLPAMQHLAAQARTRRLLGMLARRGYGAATALAAIREIEADESADGPTDGGDGLAEAGPLAFNEDAVGD
jgi:regulatory protein